MAAGKRQGGASRSRSASGGRSTPDRNQALHSLLRKAASGHRKIDGDVDAAHERLVDVLAQMSTE